jgi:hypothetical protein
MPTYTNAIRSTPSGAAVAGALQALALGGPQDWLGNASFGREMQTGVTRDDTDGFPNPPSLRFEWWGFWRFRWAVVAGTMTTTIYVKQALNQTPRPSIILKANAAVGLVVDTIFVAAAGTGWITLTPSFVATATGVIWVELWNNLNTSFSAPCLFSGPQFASWINGVPDADISGSQGGGPPTPTTGAHRVSAMQPRSRQP